MKNSIDRKSIIEMLESDSPDEIVEWLKSQTQIASLRHLYGVKERLDYHPEGDSGIHLQMCMEQAWRWCDSPEERASVLLHDIGKAVTGRAIPNPTNIEVVPIQYDEQGGIVPTHANHDQIGALMMSGVFADLGLPPDWLPLAVTVARRHQHLHGVLKLKSNTVVQFVQEVAGEMPRKTREQAIGSFVRCVRADFNGRLGFEDLNYSQGDLLVAAERAMSLFEHGEVERNLASAEILQARGALFNQIGEENPNFSLQKKWEETMKGLRNLQAEGALPANPDTMHGFVGKRLAEVSDGFNAYVPPKAKMKYSQ